MTMDTKINWPISTPDNIIPVDSNIGIKYAILFLDDEYLYGRRIDNDGKLVTGNTWYTNGRSPYGYGTDLIPPKKQSRTADVWLLWRNDRQTYHVWHFPQKQDAENCQRKYGGIIERVTLTHPEDRDNG